MSLLKACAQCGAISDQANCPAHRTKRRKASSTARGYNAAWQRVSRAARAQQDFCTDCGRTSAETPLEADHLPSAWQRVEQGLPARLGIDVEVVCGRCNIRRGAARGPNARQA